LKLQKVDFKNFQATDILLILGVSIIAVVFVFYRKLREIARILEKKLEESDLNEAMMLDGEASTVLGYNFARVRFDGWKNDQDLTTVKLGELGLTGNASSAGVQFSNTSDFVHKYPFYFTLDDSNTDQTFMIDQQTFHYRVETTDNNFTLGTELLLPVEPLLLSRLHSACMPESVLIWNFCVVSGNIEVNSICASRSPPSSPPKDHAWPLVASAAILYNS